MNSLITKSLQGPEPNINHLLTFPAELLSTGEKTIIKWIQEYTIRHGTPPTVARLSDEFDTFVPTPSADPPGDIFERVLKRKRNIFTREYILSIQDKLREGEDPLPHIEKIFGVIRGGSEDVLLYTKYDRTEYTRKLESFPYNIEAMDRYTGGAAKGDLIYILGRLGTGKTSLALWLIKRWLMQKYRILMASNENRGEDIIGKVDAFVGGWNPIKKRTAEWTPDDLEKIKTVSHIATRLEGELIIPTKPVSSVVALQGLIYQYKPDIVVVDGVYLMGSGDGRGKAMWEQVTDVSRHLKQLAMTAKVPIIGIHQASRAAIGKRVDVENAAYSDAIGQDADLVLGINQEEDGSSFVEAVKNRWGKEFGFFVKIFFDDMSVKVYDSRSLVGDDGEEV